VHGRTRRRTGAALLLGPTGTRIDRHRHRQRQFSIFPFSIFMLHKNNKTRGRWNIKEQVTLAAVRTEVVGGG